MRYPGSGPGGGNPNTDGILATTFNCVRICYGCGRLIMDDWLVKHMHGVLVTVEILWVGGFLAVFVVYFVIKYRLKRNKRRNTDHGIEDP